MIAYTLGRTSSYDESLASGEPLSKLGVRPISPEDPEGYGGGWIWQTAQEAHDFLNGPFSNDYDWLPEDFSIYEVELVNGWDIDVLLTTGSDGVHRLKNDSRIIGKVSWPSQSKS